MQQDSLSLVEFQKKFDSEEACQYHLRKMRWPYGFRCPQCNHRSAYRHEWRGLYQCKACRHQASLTTGTIFHRTKVPLRFWFLMIFLMSRPNNEISMLSMQHTFGIKSYKTVWMMGHKIKKVMADRDSANTLTVLVETDETHLGASKPGKRGHGAQGKPKGSNRRFWEDQLFDRLLTNCINTNTITYEELKK